MKKKKYWINFYDSFNNGYNQTVGDIGCRGYKHTEIELEKIRKKYNCNAVYQLDLNFNIIKKWNSASLASKTMGIYKQTIIDCCEKNNHVKSIKGFIWVYEKDINNIDYAYYSNKNISPSKMVGQFDINMNLITIWDSIYSI